MPVAFLKHRRWMTAFCVVIIAALAAVIFPRSQLDPLRSIARREWKDRAIAQIERRWNDKPWLNGELTRLKGEAVKQPYQGGWSGDELLITKNGDWIICQNVCSKEQDTSVKKDIFIGRGSDGKWYYSTFHFCVHKCVLRMELQPESLAQLADAYWLVPFDGKSDECLKITWTGGPYGDEKIQFPSTGKAAR
jgi:hypothetical protein